MASSSTGTRAVLFVAVLVLVPACAQLFGIHMLDDDGGAVGDAAPAGDGGAVGDAAPAAISFVQAAGSSWYQLMPSAQVPFTKPQTAGNLNVVAVGWYDGVPKTVTVVDSTLKNQYQQVVPPEVVDAGYNTATQLVYYASNIAPGSPDAPTVVTVTWSQPADSPDIRIVEYSGLSAPDQFAANTGIGLDASVGPVTTRHANELVLAAGITGSQGGFTEGAPGYIVRITTPNGNIVEDDIVSAQGPYWAQATIAGSNASWVLQMATFY